MDTLENKLFEIDTRSSLQIINAFYAEHTLNEVKLTLLQTLQGYVLNDQPGIIPLHLSEEQITSVFDGLVSLVRAVETLKEQGKIEGLK